MSDFNVKLTVRSARVLAAIEAKFGSQAEMARKTGFGMTRINAWVTMRETPVGEGGWKNSAVDFATALGVYPGDLWPAHMQDVKLRRATAQVSLDRDKIEALMSSTDVPVQIEQRTMLVKMAKGIRDRDMEAITLHIGNATLSEIGDELGVSGE